MEPVDGNAEAGGAGEPNCPAFGQIA